MKKILINWVLAVIAIAIATYILPGVHILDMAAAFVAALVLGVVNAVFRPVLLLLTLPINFLTLGLFTFVINAFLVLLVSALVPGFQVDGFGWALLFSLVLSLVNIGIHLFRKD